MAYSGDPSDEAPRQIFVSYSKGDIPGDPIDAFDREILNYLETMVKRRYAPFELWWDERELFAGEDWHAEIGPAIESCSAGLILVTDAFLDKTYIQNYEYPALLRRYQANEIPLYWLVLRPTSEAQLGRKCPELVQLGGPQHLLGAPFPPLSRRGAAAHAANGIAARAHVAEELVQILDGLGASLRRRFPEAFVDEAAPQPASATGVGEERRDVGIGTAIEPASNVVGRVSARVPSVEGMVGRAEAGDTAALLVRSLSDGEHPNRRAAHIGIVAEGGMGKSVLAAQIARLPSIGKAFPDGVAWAVFGQQPELHSVYRQLLADLLELVDPSRPGEAGERARAVHEFVAGADTSTEAKTAAVIQGVLQRSRVLLVLDDVWDRAPFQPLLPFDGRSRCLASSRSGDVVARARMEAVELQRLDPSQARAFLVDISGEPAKESEAEALNRVLEAANGLPLSLALYGGLARRGVEWGAVADRIVTMANRYGRGELGVRLRAQQVALAFLADRDVADADGAGFDGLSWGTVHERLLGLAVFPEDAAIPVVTLQRYWGCSAPEAEATIVALAADGFVTPDPDAGTVSVHDLTLDFLRLNAPPEMGMHQALLDAHGDLCESPGMWWTMPRSEPYLWDQLVRHLDEAGEDRALGELVRSADWLIARIRLSGPAAGATDCRRGAALHVANLVRFSPQLARAVRKERTDGVPVVPATLMAIPGLDPGRAVGWWPDVESELGHSGGVVDVGWSPDSSRVVTGSVDGTARVWDVSSGESLVTLAGHAGAVWGVGWSPDSSRVVTGSVDGTARVWDVSTGVSLVTLAGHAGAVWGVGWSPDSSRVVTGSVDGTARVWDAVTGVSLVTLTGHTGAVLGVAWSGDSFRVVTGGVDGTARVWDVLTGESLVTLTGHAGGVWAVSWSADSSRVMTGSGDGTARVWDAVTGVSLVTLTGHTVGVSGVAWSADSSQVVTGSGDGTARVWDALTGVSLVTLTGHTVGVSAVAWSADSSRVVTGSDDGTARVWDVSMGESLVTLTGHTDWVRGVAWSADSSQVVTGGDDGTARVWDAVTGVLLVTLTGHTDWVSGVAWSADSSRVVTGSGDGTARVWDAVTGESLVTLTGHTDWVLGVAWSADSSRVVTGSDDGTARVWDVSTGESLVTLTGHTDWVRGVAWSADSSRVMTGSGDGTARVWDAVTGESLVTLTGHTGGVLGVAWSADSSRVVTGGDDGTARVWDVLTGVSLVTLTGHTGGVWAVSWSADSSRVVTGSGDGTARVWDVVTGGTLAAAVLRDSVLDVAVADGSNGSLRIAMAVGLGWNIVTWDPETPKPVFA